jgi:hypothetical protein
VKSTCPAVVEKALGLDIYLPRISTAHVAGESSNSLIAQDGLYCPKCGYDLRGTPGDICSECGQKFDRTNLANGILPWPRRRQLGTIRSYLKTVWLVTFCPSLWRVEAARPQSLLDAAKFFWITIVIAELAMLAVCYRPIDTHAMQFRIEDDVLVGPTALWSMAVKLRGIWPACVALWLLDSAAAPRRLFRKGAATAELGDRGAALACYAAGPFFWMPLLTSVVFLARKDPWITNVVPGFGPFDVDTLGWSISVVPAVAAAPLLMVLGSVAIAYKRFTGSGDSRSLWAVARLLLHWLVSAFLLLVVLPCCLAYAWMALLTLLGYQWWL